MDGTSSSQPPTLHSVEEILEDLHRTLLSNREGAVADYIPELAKADPEWFGICLTSVDGSGHGVGDLDIPFTIQSMSKPLVFALALEDNGWERVLEKVGVEPTGEAFNAIVLDEVSNRPFNPMVNAGAIATTALIQAGDGAERDGRILDVMERLTGRALGVDETVFQSERDTGHRNRAIAHLMRNFDMLDGEVDSVLDSYFRQCSVSVTCRDLAMIGATLANGGTNPRTGERVFRPDTARRVLALMSSCGMYDYAGEWAYRVGWPAKSGVSGGIVGVLPGQFGIGVFSPRLDAKGNTARGIAACETLSERLALHPFATLPNIKAVVRRSYGGDKVASGRQRTVRESDFLRHEGHLVQVIEAQGALYLGTIDHLIHEVERRTKDARHVILDLSRITQVESRSLPLLLDLATMAETRGQTLSLALPSSKTEIREQLRAAIISDSGAEMGKGGRPGVFDSARDALEWAEQTMIAQGPTLYANHRPYGLREIEVLDGLGDEALKVLEQRISALHFPAGTMILSKGDHAEAFFILIDGLVSIQVGEETPRKVVATIGPGCVFGEMSLFEGKRRTADVFAEEAVTCYAISGRALDDLDRRFPGTQVRILTNIARALAARLRRADEEVASLVS